MCTCIHVHVKQLVYWNKDAVPLPSSSLPNGVSALFFTPKVTNKPTVPTTFVHR